MSESGERVVGTSGWRTSDWPRLVVVSELLLVAALLLRLGPEAVPALTELQRASAVLAEVDETCRTDPVAGGPATVTFCHVDLVFAGSIGRAGDPYGALFPSGAATLRNALLPLRGRTVDVWLLRPEGGEGRPEIWQLTYDGVAIIAYADVAAYHADFDRGFARVFGLPACLICLMGALWALRRERHRRPAPDADAVASADLPATRALDALMGIALLAAVWLCLQGEGGGAVVVVMLCVLLSFLYWPESL